MQSSTCQQQQAQPGQNGTSASRTSFLIEDILNRGTVTPHHPHHHQLHHQHLTSTSAHSQHHQYQQFASLLPGYPAAPPAAAAFFLASPLFSSTGMGVGMVPGVGELAALKHCRRRKARTVSTLSASTLRRDRPFYWKIKIQTLGDSKLIQQSIVDSETTKGVSPHYVHWFCANLYIILHLSQLRRDKNQ